MLAGGLYNMHLEGTGYVALLSDGPPMMIQIGAEPTYADPQAAITWSAGVTTAVKADVNMKTLIGRGSGETIQIAFGGQGWALIQPSEGQVAAPSQSGGSAAAPAAPSARCSAAEDRREEPWRTSPARPRRSTSSTSASGATRAPARCTRRAAWCRGTFTAERPRARALAAPRTSRRTRSRCSRASRTGAATPGSPTTRPTFAASRSASSCRTAAAPTSSARACRGSSRATPEAFLDFIRANTGRSAAWKLPRFLATHPKALRHLPENAKALRPVASFAETRFYGVHAFRWLDAEGAATHVRCDWRPEAGQRWLGGSEAKALGRDYLHEGSRD